MAKRKGRYAILSGDFWRNKKIEALSPEAVGVLAMCFSYCADQMTDGEIPVKLVRSWCGGKRANRIIRELTTRPENWPDGHYFPILVRIRDRFSIHNYLERNLSRKNWERILERDRERKQKDAANFLPGIPPDSRGNPPRNPNGSSRPKTQDSLKREREEGKNSLSLSFSNSKQIRKEEENGTVSPHILVTELWVEIGREVTGDMHLQADPELEEDFAWRLWERARALEPGAPLQTLAGVFRSYWQAKRAAGGWPAMRFCLQDFDAHRGPAPDEQAREQASAEERRAIDREYELRQRLEVADGRHQLLKTPETETAFREARAEYMAFKQKGIGNGGIRT